MGLSGVGVGVAFLTGGLRMGGAWVGLSVGGALSGWYPTWPFIDAGEGDGGCGLCGEYDGARIGVL